MKLILYCVDLGLLPCNFFNRTDTRYTPRINIKRGKKREKEMRRDGGKKGRREERSQRRETKKELQVRIFQQSPAFVVTENASKFEDSYVINILVIFENNYSYGVGH